MGQALKTPNPAPKRVPPDTGRAVTPLRFSHKHRKTPENTAAIRGYTKNKLATVLASYPDQTFYFTGDVKSMRARRSLTVGIPANIPTQATRKGHLPVVKTHLMWLETADGAGSWLITTETKLFSLECVQLVLIWRRCRPLPAAASALTVLGWGKVMSLHEISLPAPIFFFLFGGCPM